MEAKEKKYMEKFKSKIMKFLYSIFLLLSSIALSQNKTIVPTTGTIVFVKEENIFDKDLFIKSFKDLMPKMKEKMKEEMKEEIYLERLIDGKKTDTLLLNSEVEKMVQNFEMMLPFIIEEPRQKIKIHHEFNFDTITKYYSIEGEINNRIFINRISNVAKNENNEYVEIENNDIIKLTEYKNETKLINGFKCFKVVYSLKALNNNFDFINLTLNNRELWVTEEIKCNYHPIINEIELLEKYYPLEILEYSDEIKGTLTNYKIETLNIN
jgi:hypothetical protein